jgi:hypothetical protein
MFFIRILGTLILLISGIPAKGQAELETATAGAAAEMGLRNMYHTISWGMSPLNPYLFDQDMGTVTYTVEERGLEVIAQPKVLGTFNLKDKTFLWADQNASIDKKLSDRVAAFRQSLPEAYQKAKFRATTESGLSLLALFGVQVDANATDFQRQGDTVIYFALVEIEVLRDGKVQQTILPKNHVSLQQDDALLALVKEFLEEKCAVNRMHHEEKLELEQAFERMEEVHLRYWANEDPYFFPALSWPCANDPKSILDWQVFSVEGGRKFVMFMNDLGYSRENRAYEIDPKATGKKLIINEY